jgi:hypothetical protein
LRIVKNPKRVKNKAKKIVLDIKDQLESLERLDRLDRLDKLASFYELVDISFILSTFAAGL